ncbi:MAG: hypothetical protein IJW20_07680 [Clostridia bacterium]|nr:hypothetical protein [Clostridia bacterium]
MDLNAYKIAFSEVLVIINNMHPENKKRIPKKFMDFLEESRYKDYNPSQEDINLENEKNLKKETRVILAIIYKKYFSNVDLDPYKKEEDKMNDIFSGKENVSISNVNKYSKFLYEVTNKLKRLISRVFGVSQGE